MPKVSIIIPAYNNGTYLPRALDSVMKQTFKDFEIVIIDDGSTDDTIGVADRYAAAHPGRISVLRQPNRGPGSARNTGLREAKGEYIAFLDADDWWVNTKLAKQVAVLDRDRDIGLVYTNLFFADRSGRTVPHGEMHKFALPRGNVSLEFFNRYFMYTSTVLVRRTCAEQTGRFREDLRVSEDLDFFLRVSARFRVECLDEKLLAKVSRSDSLSSVDSLVNATSTFRALSDFARSNPAYFRQHRKIITVSLARINLWIGSTAMKQGRRSQAVPYLARALWLDPGIKTVKGMVKATVPPALARYIRRHFRRLRRPNEEETNEHPGIHPHMEEIQARRKT